MGVCASSNPKTSSSSSSGLGNKAKSVGGNMRVAVTTSSAKVVDMDGGVKELRQLPIQVKSIVSQNPNSFLCSCESMSIGACPPKLDEDEELQPGQIYFLLPLSLSNKPLSLPQLCSLAVKAATGLQGQQQQQGRHTTTATATSSLQLSSTHSNLILG